MVSREETPTQYKAPGLIWEVKDPIRLHGEKRRAEITAHLLKPKRDDLILDVGCGEGFQIGYIVRRSAQIVGIDFSAERLKEAKKRVKEAYLVCASADKLPFRHKAFDKVTCLELLEHLKNPRETIEEIEAIMKERGTLIVSVPYKEHILATKCIHCGELTPLWGHIQIFDEQKLASLLPHNFEVVQRVYVGTPIAAYPLFSSLPTKLWKLIDDFGKALPGMKPSWFINKILKK